MGLSIYARNGFDLGQFTSSFFISYGLRDLLGVGAGNVGLFPLVRGHLVHFGRVHLQGFIGRQEVNVS